MPQYVSLFIGVGDLCDLWRPTVRSIANVNLGTFGTVHGGASSDEKHGGG